MAHKSRRMLTDQEWLLCDEYISRGDLLRAAYIAYPKLKTRTRAQAHHAARKILSRKVVREQLDQMRADLRSSQRVTLDQHLTILADIRDEARDGEQYAAAARCEELRGRAAGFYFEQHVHISEPAPELSEVKSKVLAMLEAHPQLRLLMEKGSMKKIESSVSVKEVVQDSVHVSEDVELISDVEPDPI